MILENICRLTGTVQGANWSRYNRHQRGQVRFWLAVPRELAGDGFDLLLCAIEPKTVEELLHFEAELRPGRTVELHAGAHTPAGLYDQDKASVIFVAESCGFGGAPVVDVHAKHHARPHGKMAAAGDNTELPLEVSG